MSLIVKEKWIMERTMEKKLLWAMAKFLNYACKIDEDFEDEGCFDCYLRYDKYEMPIEWLINISIEEVDEIIDKYKSDVVTALTLQEEMENDTLVASFRCEGYIYELLYNYESYGRDDNKKAERILDKLNKELGEIGLWFDWGGGCL